MITRMGGDPFAKRRLMWFGSPTIPLTFVLTPDLAGYLADAVDAPGVDGQRIDIGWDRPVSMQEIAQISGQLLGQQIRVRTIPAGLINTAAAVVGRFNPMVKDMDAMMRWFQTGRYVADPTRQREVFGQVPTAEDAIARFLRSLGHAHRRLNSIHQRPDQLTKALNLPGQRSYRFMILFRLLGMSPDLRSTCGQGSSTMSVPVAVRCTPS